ncbi:hypothetical protein Ddc_14958 [Ditylenchus destructor]|nr:hypothetical protein Ddc_14958 [Ditylenchus destructor]
MSTVEAKKMRRSARLTPKQAKVENESQKEPKAKKKRSSDEVSNIASVDNETMLEVFKSLNYPQLAKKSLVSKRFRDVIRSHRHTLALLHVDYMMMYPIALPPTAIKIFDQELSPKAYNEWVIRNKYCKHIPLENQVINRESTQSIQKPTCYSLSADYKGPNRGGLHNKSTVIDAIVEFKDKNWPVFEHFARLASDPFIYVDRMHLTAQIDVLNLLAAAIYPRDRLQYKEFTFNLESKGQKSLTKWAKVYVRCNTIDIWGKDDSNHDDELLDFSLTGAQCTSEVKVFSHDLKNVVADFIQKFLDLKNWDEYQGVKSIESYQVLKNQIIRAVKKKYAKYFVKEEQENVCTTKYIFNFINNSIGKKLQLTVTDCKKFGHCYHLIYPLFSLKIKEM